MDLVSGDKDEVFKLNRAFLDIQIANKKRFYFSHDPRLELPGTLLAKEYNHLQSTFPFNDLQKTSDGLLEFIVF